MPDAGKPFASGLTCCRISREVIERVPTVLHLRAIGVCLDAQLARERGCARGSVRPRDKQRGPDAGTSSAAHRRRRHINGSVVEGHPLGIGENGLRLPTHRRRRCLDKRA